MFYQPLHIYKKKLAIKCFFGGKSNFKFADFEQSARVGPPAYSHLQEFIKQIPHQREATPLILLFPLLQRNWPKEIQKRRPLLILKERVTR